MQITKASGALAAIPSPTAYIGARDIGVVVGTLDIRVEAFDRAALRQVERLALGHTLDDVEQDDIAQPLERGEVRQRAADITGADQRDLLASHSNPTP